MTDQTSQPIRDAISLAVSIQMSQLYNALLGLAHGDDDHKRWLTEAVTAIFNGHPVPPPYGKANWEAERDELRATVERLQAQYEDGHKINTALAEWSRTLQVALEKYASREVHNDDGKYARKTLEAQSPQDAQLAVDGV